MKKMFPQGGNRIFEIRKKKFERREKKNSLSDPQHSDPGCQESQKTALNASRAHFLMPISFQ